MELRKILFGIKHNNSAINFEALWEHVVSKRSNQSSGPWIEAGFFTLFDQITIWNFWRFWKLTLKTRPNCSGVSFAHEETMEEIFAVWSVQRCSMRKVRQKETGGGGILPESFTITGNPAFAHFCGWWFSNQFDTVSVTHISCNTDMWP